MESIEKDDWAARLADEEPDRWPAGLRAALHAVAPEPPAGLDERIAGILAGGGTSAGGTSADAGTSRGSGPPGGARVLPFYRRPLYQALAASLLVALGLTAVFLRPEPVEIQVLRSHGQVQVERDGERLPSTDVLRRGDRILLAADSALEVSFAGGLHLQLIGPARARFRTAAAGGIETTSANTTVDASAHRTPGAAQIEPLELSLEAGEVFFVSRDRAVSRAFTFATERARYALAGTAGLLTVNASVESLRVIEGAVDLRYRDSQDALRVPEAHWVLVDRLPGEGLPALNKSDEHSFMILCRRRDRLLKVVTEERAADPDRI